jgi:hypothetical protein
VFLLTSFEVGEADDSNFSPTWSEAERGVHRRGDAEPVKQATNPSRVSHAQLFVVIDYTLRFASCVAKVMIACFAGLRPWRVVNF